LDTDALQDAIKSNRRQKLGSAEAIIKEKNSGILGAVASIHSKMAILIN